jgi:hypothetical protein
MEFQQSNDESIFANFALKKYPICSTIICNSYYWN